MVPIILFLKVVVSKSIETSAFAPLEGGLCDGFSAISDDKPIDLAVRLEERRKLLIKRNQPVSGFTLSASCTG